LAARSCTEPLLADSVVLTEQDVQADPETTTQFTCDDVIEELGFGRFQTRLLFITGALFSSDAMIMMLVSFLSPSARCAFHLTVGEEALLASIVFVGMFFGSYVCGVAADKYGRRAVFLGTAACVSIFGIFSALSLNYGMLLFGQMMVGFGVGGVPVAFSLFAEFIPASERGQYLVGLQVFWTLGSLGAAAVAWIVMPTLGWRWLLIICTAPSFGLLFFHKYVPESPRWQAATGKNRVACDSLRAVAYQNGVDWTFGDYQDLQVTKAREQEASFLDLFDGGYAKLTLVLWVLWLSCTMLYYGIILLTTQIFETGHDLDNGPRHCHKMQADDFARAFITSTAEVPSLVAAVLMVDRVGRRMTLVSAFAALSAFLLLLIMVHERIWWETFAIFCSRAAANTAFTVVYISTGEMYPTAIRSTGLGTASAMARIGGFAAPFVSAVLFDASEMAALLVFSVVAGFAALASLELPETGGAALPDAGPKHRAVAGS